MTCWLHISQKARYMSVAVGKIQAAIWRTEEAIEVQKLRIADETDPWLIEHQRRGLVTLQDVLDIHRRTLGFLLAMPETAGAFARHARETMH